MNISKKLKSFTPLHYAAAGLFLIAIALRLFRITDNQFLFYDEGMYLGFNRNFLNLVGSNPPQNINDFCVIIGLMFKNALTTAKALWFFLLNLRVFFLGADAWYFARIISALSGFATIVLTYFWAKRHFNETIAFWSALILAILPSHVFYSRLGMQETLSTLLFISAIFLYTSTSKINWRFIVSAILLSCVFLTNYRMIIAPIFIGVIEGLKWLESKKPIDWKKLSIYAAIFYGIVFFIGSLYGGVNRYVTFGWMFHQAQDASGKFDPINFLSYPYYVFALEGILFGVLFWSNLRLAFLRQWSRLLPFAIVAVQMGLFSFAAEKGARYLCVVLPFMAVAGAVALNFFWEQYKISFGLAIQIAVALMILFMLVDDVQLALSRTQYKLAIENILAHDPESRIVSTQPLVEELYSPRLGQIIPCPNDLGGLMEAYKQGGKYLVLDPQAYISWTANGERFSPPLVNFLEITRQEVKPLFVLDHLQGIYLKRFVLDHNERLINSLRFLANPSDYGQIKVYDLRVVLSVIHNHALNK